jgi:S-formylglutathione hydrolase FrmB
MIVVMPNGFSLHKGSMYSSSVTTGDWETFIARDLVSYVDGHYRTIADRTSRGLAGHSMGGYGTLRIGMKRPDVFSSLYSLSACCLTAQLNPNPESMAASAAIDLAFTRLGIEHAYQEYDGDHTNRVGERVEVGVLPFFSRSLSFSATPTSTPSPSAR